MEIRGNTALLPGKSAGFGGVRPGDLKGPGALEQESPPALLQRGAGGGAKHHGGEQTVLGVGLDRAGAIELLGVERAGNDLAQTQTRAAQRSENYWSSG
jgi:hypothetical protein